MIAIIDYGVGNLFSLSSSFKVIGYDTVVTGDEKTIKEADKVILPGVGAFSDAIAKLRDSGLDKVVYEENPGDSRKLSSYAVGSRVIYGYGCPAY